MTKVFVASATDDYRPIDKARAYVHTMFDRRGNTRGYAVYGPDGRIRKRFERRTYLSLRTCLELAEGLRDAINGMIDRTT